MSCLLYLSVLGFLGGIQEILMYHQEEYIVTTDRVEVPYVNKDYMEVKFKNFKLNRTFLAINATWQYKKDFGRNIMISVQALKFYSNEYRLFPMAFTVNFCEILQSNRFGMQNLYDCGSGAYCPMIKGNYSLCNWSPDYSHFPPHIPMGNYRLDLKFLYNSEEMVYIQCYWTIRSTKFL